MRADRLLALLDLLRRYRAPAPASRLAEELGVSVRTLYRDVQILRARGAEIEGEAGFGYVLKPGFLLPPLMFSASEIEALVLGSRWVAERGDGELAKSAAQALAKIESVLPAALRNQAETTGLIVYRAQTPDRSVDPARLREAIRRERRIEIAYTDGADRASRRAIWPIALAYFDRVEILVGWCELRADFRHFRLDRIRALEMTEARYPRRRAVLLKEWRASQGIANPYI